LKPKGRLALLGWILAWLFIGPALLAQERPSALSDAEIEKLRESSYVPNERVMIFIGFLNDRCDAIQKLSSGPRRPGREEDLHEQYEQFTSIADELDDNLDDYGPRHKDLRKALPKLLQAAERWATALRTPAENEAYAVARRLALEALRDVREEATAMLAEQKTYFAAHPPNKDGSKEQGTPVREPEANLVERGT
jgi:hypothetical protein